MEERGRRREEGKGRVQEGGNIRSNRERVRMRKKKKGNEMI